MSNAPLRSGGPTGMRHVWRLVERHRVRMALLAFVSFLSAIFEAGFLVLLTGTVVAMAAGNAALAPVLGVSLPVRDSLAIGGVAIAVRLALGLISSYLAASLVTSVTVDERRRLSEGFLRASWSVQQAEPSGRLQELMGNFVSRSTFTVTAVTQGITATLSLLAFLGTGVAINPLLTAGVVVALAILGTVLAPIRRAIRRLSSQQARSGVKFANSVAEFASLGQEMHAFGAQQHFLDRIDSLAIETANDSRRVLIAQGALTPAYTFLAYGAALGGMALLWAFGISDLAAIGAVMLLMLRSLSYAQQLITVSGQFASSIPYLEDFAKILDRYKSGAAHRGVSTPPKTAPLRLQQVEFSYDDRRIALKGLSAEIHHGEIIGVIGPSGAGKSTLAQLLLGLRDPSAGKVSVHGIDLREVERSWWSTNVSFVPQDPVLFTGTVAENIRFFRSGISQDDLRSAAHQANVLRDIEALPQKFDTHLGERGSQLSGGQRQRLSIARALAGKPELLIMDEPTSALDGRSEQLIRDTMAQLKGHVTMVVIAHRLSTLDLCDRIMVIEQGRMTDFDKPSAVYERSDYYRRALAGAGIAGPQEEPE